MRPYIYFVFITGFAIVMYGSFIEPSITRYFGALLCIASVFADTNLHNLSNKEGK
jgi:hypothetical protein